MILCRLCTLEVVATLPDQCLHSSLSGVGGVSWGLVGYPASSWASTP